MQDNPSISYLKAIGIILMVVGHCIGVQSVPYCIIYMFHMPLFFFAAGFCFKRTYLNNFESFLFRRIKGLYVPFVKWGLFFLLLHNLFFIIHIYDEELGYLGNSTIHPINNYDFFTNILHIVFFMRGQPPIIGAFWFLNVLFWGSIISYVLLKVFTSPEKAAMMALTITLCLNFGEVYIPFIWITPQLFAASFLFLVGHVFAFRKTKVFCEWQILLSMMMVVLGSFFWYSELVYSFFSTARIIPYMTTALLAIWSIYSFFNKYESHMPSFISHLLLFIGNNTLSILTFHFLAFKLVSLLIIVIYNLPIKRLGELPVIMEFATQGWWIAYTVVGVGLPLAITSYIRKRNHD